MTESPNTPAALRRSVAPPSAGAGEPPVAVGVAEWEVRFVGHYYDGECDHCTDLGPYHSNFGMAAVRRVR